MDRSHELARVARSLADRPALNVVALGPPREPRGRTGKSARSSNGGDPSGQIANPASSYRFAGLANLSSRLGIKIDPLTVAIIVMVGVVAFQQTARQIDRRSPQQPELTRLLFAPKLGI
jgi:hypothetical protein